jgi:hypothetical protein
MANAWRVAKRLVATAPRRGDAVVRSVASASKAVLVRIPDMAHALADEPGLAPAPRTASAAAVDRALADWLRSHLR